MQTQAFRGCLRRTGSSSAAVFSSKLYPLSRQNSQWTSSSSSDTSSTSSFSLDTTSTVFFDSSSILETVTHETSLFEPISSTLLSIPPSLALSYAIGIPLLTLFIRTTTTLPLTLWQRSRTRKFEEVVMPLIQRAQVISEIEVRAECRKANKTYEEYQAIHKIRAKEDAAKISKKYNVHPMLTLILPPLLHLPIFIGATLTIRDACQRSLDSLVLLPTSLDSSPVVNASTSSTFNFYTNEALTHLHNLATTPLLWCESMVLPDPTMAFPLAVGLVLLANVEASAKNRTAIATAHALINASKQEDESPENLIKKLESKQKKDLSVNDRALLRRKRELESRVKTLGGKVLEASTVKSTPKELQIKPETRFSKNFTTVLRIVSVCFIPFAAFSPSAVCAYWLTSNLFTLTQNTIFALLDKKRSEKKLNRSL